MDIGCSSAVLGKEASAAYLKASLKRKQSRESHMKCDAEELAREKGMVLEEMIGRKRFGQSLGLTKAKAKER